MAEAITEADADRDVEALHQLATEVLNEHAHDHGLCVACGCVFPCERAVLAEHNLAL